jgi:hypothetical protein
VLWSPATRPGTFKPRKFRYPRLESDQEVPVGQAIKDKSLTAPMTSQPAKVASINDLERKLFAGHKRKLLALSDILPLDWGPTSPVTP